jgi:SAM-dependent methyltransferase
MNYEEVSRTCEVCGSEEFKPFWEKKAWTKARIVIKQGEKMFHTKDVFCMNCGLVYKNPMLTRDSQKHFYNGPYARLAKPNQQTGIPKTDIVEGVIQSVYVLDFLRASQIDLKDKKVLEVGTGMGTLLRSVQSLGATVHGIDTDKRSCEISRKIHGLQVDNVDVFSLQSDTHYDVIFCCNTLEHMYSPRELLQKMQQLLTKDGIVVIEIPSYRYPYVHCYMDAFFSSAHNYTFSHDSFAALANQCGYGIAQFGYSGHNSCMIFALTTDEVIEKDKRDVVNYNQSLSIVKAYNMLNAQTQDIGKELFETLDVNSIIKRVLSEMPYTSNFAFMSFAQTLLEAGHNQHVIDLMEQYRDGQSENTEICYAAFVHYKGLALRQMGDFLGAKKCFQEAKENYPRFGDYNFIQDLKIDGVLSDSSFSILSWLRNERMLKELG